MMARGVELLSASRTMRVASSKTFASMEGEDVLEDVGDLRKEATSCQYLGYYDGNITTETHMGAVILRTHIS